MRISVNTQVSIIRAKLFKLRADNAGTPMGLLSATREIWRQNGLRGLFQGHSMTLLRVFPYAGVKFVAYDWLEAILIPTPDKRTPGRFFLAGAASGRLHSHLTVVFV